MKAAVSIPDQILEAVDRLAKIRNVSRNQLFAEALSEYVSRQAAAVTTKLNGVYCREASGVETPLAQAQIDAIPRETRVVCGDN